MVQEHPTAIDKIARLGNSLMLRYKSTVWNAITIKKNQIFACGMTCRQVSSA